MALESLGGRLPFPALHGLHDEIRFQTSDFPPLATGVTWSISKTTSGADFPQY